MLLGVILPKVLSPNVEASEKILHVNDQNFKKTLEAQPSLVLVDFFATWCGPCKLIQPHLNKLADEHAKEQLTVCKLDIDKSPKTANAYAVQSIPTLILFKEGKEIERSVGAYGFGHYQKWVAKHLPKPEPEAEAAVATP